MSNNELGQLLSKVHKEITTFNFKNTKVPCIIFPEKKFEEILGRIAGRPVAVDTNLNILQDGLGHVFVEICLTFSIANINEKILLYANESLEFFELLAKTAMLALSSPPEINKENIFMIQLPKPEKAVNAFEIIKKGLNSGKNNKIL